MQHLTSNHSVASKGKNSPPLRPPFLFLHILAGSSSSSFVLIMIFRPSLSCSRCTSEKERQYGDEESSSSSSSSYWKQRHSLGNGEWRQICNLNIYLNSVFSSVRLLVPLLSRLRLRGHCAATATTMPSRAEAQVVGRNGSPACISSCTVCTS